ncbi:DNA-3-methyladenine glycosylase I [Endozoicomonas sp. GU-1]|uniref:DNA-3-methyladenine glycosylase I n=1 Tax=Endozoicomonas sp. GU-1 TaxID=3009078 RepID=UPI0022B33529|nr:DNA-3-methyladenine glycosylase I [Endozoicomonas sp. GU-1]WBA82647.1 DNA-3-methyladenine glycosylase I [Endozoicomonas sp. GU-1]WBA85576.1 DNA-3-methyladenine glycosylase I [Endozoicomonas sp. GU-1]
MNDARCSWCHGDELYTQYHDKEWGVPCHNDQKLFEFLILEGAQAGLSWITILKRREGYRTAFHQFDVQQVARMTDQDVEKLMQDEGIIRNRLKIRSAINNARAFIRVQEEFGSFSQYLWSFVNHQPIINRRQSMNDVPATTDISDRMSDDLKKRGFSFVGSTICYAYMQAMGLVNDHLVSCPSYLTEKVIASA